MAELRPLAVIAVRRQHRGEVEPLAEFLDQAVVWIEPGRNAGLQPLLRCGVGLCGDAILLGLPRGQECACGLPHPRGIEGAPAT